MIAGSAISAAGRRNWRRVLDVSLDSTAARNALSQAAPNSPEQSVLAIASRDHGPKYRIAGVPDAWRPLSDLLVARGSLIPAATASANFRAAQPAAESDRPSVVEPSTNNQAGNKARLSAEHGAGKQPRAQTFNLRMRLSITCKAHCNHCPVGKLGAPVARTAESPGVRVEAPVDSDRTMERLMGWPAGWLMDLEVELYSGGANRRRRSALSGTHSSDTGRRPDSAGKSAIVSSTKLSDVRQGPGQAR